MKFGTLRAKLEKTKEMDPRLVDAVNQITDFYVEQARSHPEKGNPLFIAYDREGHKRELHYEMADGWYDEWDVSKPFDGKYHTDARDATRFEGMVLRKGLRRMGEKIK